MTMRNHLPFLAGALFVASTIGAQATVGPWSLADALPRHFGNVGLNTTNAPGVQIGACVTVKAVATVLGPPTVIGVSACDHRVEATTTLTVGPTARYVNFSYTLVGLLNDMALGEICMGSADVTLNGGTILAYSPLPAGQITPCLPTGCAPLLVNHPGGIVLCVPPGVHTVVARLYTDVYDTMLVAGQSTTSDFFTGGNGLTVCVTDQGPCGTGPCIACVPNFVGFSYNAETGATSRGALGTAAGEVMTRLDGSEHAGWGTDLAGMRTIVSLYCVVQDQDAATPTTFDIKLYPENPANPGYPNLAAGVVFATGIPGPTGTGIVAAAHTVTPATPVSVPITGGGDIFVSFVLPSAPGWPNTDGSSMHIVLGYQPNSTFTVYDTPGAAQGGTPPPSPTPANSHGLSYDPATGSLQYNTRRHNQLDVAHNGSGGVGLAITNQASFPSS
ncbi:MAG TPA: hypothetical protein VK348_04930, partial [Planctomycetota bacterium]|nr:hypothetical protein [Planctomycetota bacterium]